MGMEERMKKKAICATKAKRSNKVIKTISKADIEELFRQLEPIFEQNRREYNAGLEAIEKKGNIYREHTNDIPLEKNNKELVKKL